RALHPAGGGKHNRGRNRLRGRPRKLSSVHVRRFILFRRNEPNPGCPSPATEKVCPPTYFFLRSEYDGGLCKIQARRFAPAMPSPRPGFVCFRFSHPRGSHAETTCHLHFSVGLPLVPYFCR